MRRHVSSIGAARGSHGAVSARLLVAFVFVAVAVAGIAAALALAPPEVIQPIAFNHSLHLDEVGLECIDCHLYATSGERTVIPNVQTCADCHVEAMTDSAEEARLVEYINSGEPIPWKQVYWVPEHVYFSHRRHTTAAEIDCETCHGPVSGRTEPLTRRLEPITMDGCMDCHDRSGVSNDCILCHR